MIGRSDGSEEAAGPEGGDTGAQAQPDSAAPARPGLRLPAGFTGILLALLPAAILVLALALARALDPVAAASIGVALAAGAVWTLSRARRPDEDPAALPRLPPANSMAILEPLPDPVLVLDSRRCVIAANRAARDLFAIGRTGRDLAQFIRHPAVLAAVDTVTSGVPVLSEEIELPVAVPHTFTLFAARLESGSAPDVPAVIVALHDETRAKRAEQSRADFVANASHELRSPLSALIGFIETLRGPARSDEEAQERFLEVMRREALRMARLIEDLLSLSRVEINEHVPPRDRVDVAATLDEVAGILSGRASDRQMELRLTIPDALSPVRGDTDQLHQVFHNLIDNAIKYGKPRTPVRVSARAVERMPGSGGNAVAITVSDEGDGIPSVSLPRVTERFYRIDEGRSRKLGGTGLGLAIVKHIINRHRGYLRIESRVGEGSNFTVYLPVAPETTKADVVTKASQN